MQNSKFVDECLLEMISSGHSVNTCRTVAFPDKESATRMASFNRLQMQIGSPSTSLSSEPTSFSTSFVASMRQTSISQASVRNYLANEDG
jgi:hypothetical protein